MGHCVHLVGMKVVFTKCSLIVLQAVLPRRADPTELKAIFEKVGFYLSIFCFLFCVCFLSKKLFTYHSIYACFVRKKETEDSKAQHASLCLYLFFSLQYASVKKNDECFMLPEDFVSRFLHAHTDIRLSNEATKLLAGVVDQKKDGLVFLWIPF